MSIDAFILWRNVVENLAEVFIRGAKIRNVIIADLEYLQLSQSSVVFDIPSELFFIKERSVLSNGILVMV